MYVLLGYVVTDNRVRHSTHIHSTLVLQHYNTIMVNNQETPTSH